MKVLKFSFLGVVGAFVVGVYAGSHIGFLLTTILFLAFILTLLVFHFFKVSVYFRHPFISFIYYFFVMLAFFGLGSLVANAHQAIQDQNHYRFTSIDGSKHKIRLVLNESLKTTNYGKRFYADIISVDSTNSRGRILVVVRDSLLVPDVGQEWLLFQELRKLPPPSSYGEFDYSEYLQTKDVYAEVYLESASAYFLTNQGGFKNRLRALREKWMYRVQQSIKEPEIANLAMALLFGERNNLDVDLVESFKRTGVMHVLAISGLHVGILFFLLQFVFQRFSIFLKTFCILLFLWFFVFLSGFSPSVFRAVLMCSFFVLSRSLRRQQSVFNTIAFALLVSLCIRPKWLFDVGFQLSYAAVFSIVFFYPIMRPYLKSRWQILRYFKELMAISIAAQLGVLPLIIHYFHQFPLFFILGNLIAIPLITLLLFLGFAILFISLVWIDLSVLIGFVFSFVSNLLILGIEELNHLGLFVLEGIPFHLTLVFSMTLFIYVLGYTLKRKKLIHVYVLLVTLIVFQIHWMVLRMYHVNQEFLVIPNDRDHLYLLHKTSERIDVYNYGDAFLKKKRLEGFKRTTWVSKDSVKSGDLFFEWSNKKFLIVNSEAAISYKGPCDVVVFSGTVSLNFNRLLMQLDPEQVIIHNSVPPWDRELIIAFCVKEKIPFHDCSEKGFYKI